MSEKRQNGCYFTQGNPFAFPAFREWAARAGLPGATLLEPFAGAGDLIRKLQAQGWCKRYAAYDIQPASQLVAARDTIAHFPRGFDVCVTNPPWLAKNSATRRGLAYPQTPFDDLYKHCLSLCLLRCGHVAALVPASFLQSGLFRERLAAYILLHGEMFNDTDNPSCLALFHAGRSQEVRLYNDDQPLGTLAALSRALPKPKRDRGLRFNDPEGRLGFISFDSTERPSIRFCEPEEIAAYPIKHSSRFITRIGGDFGNVARMVKRLNRRLKDFRAKTQDVFLTPFKGMRKDGRYRRRMEYALARELINAV